MNKKKKRVFRKVFTLLLVLGGLFLHFYIPRFITEIRNPLLRIVKGNYFNSSPKFVNNKSNGKFINFKSFDNVELSCYFTYSKLDTVKGTIILLHGIRSSKECFIGLSNKLSKLGFNTVALDSRAHGESGGVHCTFGVKEKKDISALINTLSKEGIIGNIGIWGRSLGGAIGLQALATEKRIKFGIIESTFSDFKTITNDYFTYHTGFNSKILTSYLVYRAGKIAKFNPKDARPIKYCEKIEQPILIVHGDKDKRINIRYAKNNFSKIPSSKKEFIEIKNANHLNVWDVGGDKYFERIVKFIEENTIGNKR